ncbi:MAG: DNRLRE domain-containing protein, partial [Vicinamibacterales bacterium]
MMRMLFGPLSIALIIAHGASAQTTVTLNTASTVADVSIRGGSYAATNFERELLVTRLSSNASYIRRSLFDFDTQSTIPAGAVIQSAVLTVTVHWGGVAPTRQVGVYAVTRAFTAGDATWDVASSATPWTKAGGDLGPRVTVGSVPNTDGAKASFDVSALVQNAMTSSASRRTRLALVDVDSLSSGREGYRDYYSVEATDPTVRPRLIVTYGSPIATSPVPDFSHAVIIVFENHEFDEIIGNPTAPYFNALAAQYALGTNYDGVRHPSLPNYMALTGG